MRNVRQATDISFNFTCHIPLFSVSCISVLLFVEKYKITFFRLFVLVLEGYKITPVFQAQLATYYF